jgi:hypothetical protein
MDEDGVLEGWGAGAAAHHFMSGGCWLWTLGWQGGGEQVGESHVCLRGGCWYCCTPLMSGGCWLFIRVSGDRG